jgi:hypothetical protein
MSANTRVIGIQRHSPSPEVRAEIPRSAANEVDQAWALLQPVRESAADSWLTARQVAKLAGTSSRSARQALRTLEWVDAAERRGRRWLLSAH